MSDLGPTRQAIAEMAEAVRIGRIQLAGLIMAVCPGPHRFVQHCDHRKPWCRQCRYTETGELVSAEEER